MPDIKKDWLHALVAVQNPPFLQRSYEGVIVCFSTNKKVLHHVFNRNTNSQILLISCGQLRIRRGVGVMWKGLLTRFSVPLHLGPRYEFNRVEISKEIYAPEGHYVIESDQEIIRRGLAKLFSGEFAIPMDVKSIPADPVPRELI